MPMRVSVFSRGTSESACASRAGMTALALASAIPAFMISRRVAPRPVVDAAMVASLIHLAGRLERRGAGLSRVAGGQLSVVRRQHAADGASIAGGLAVTLMMVG